jgi:pantoate--beta-alanine ligase
MQVQNHPHALQLEALERRSRGERIGFVPTMGYLHQGHTSLLDLAREHCDWLVASIYVNPLQFAPGEDLAAYPRDPKGDSEKCRAHGVDCLFMPSSLYLPDHATRVQVTGLNQGLCGGSRPTHFEGVTTVVSRLFGLVQPNIAVFGEKDYQQLAIIRRMVRDLAMPIEVLGGALVRDKDGLALSSRNAYLSAEERQRATSIYRALTQMGEQTRNGERDCSVLLENASKELDVDRLDYLEIRDGLSLEPLRSIQPGARAFAAAWVGHPRLIDNLELLQ